MAEGYFRKLTDGASIKTFSAGLAAGFGWRASPEAVAVMKRFDVDISRHISQPLNDRMVEAADMLVVMTEMHRESLLRKWPDAGKKVFLLREFLPGESAANPSIMDPVGCPAEVYEKCFDLMKTPLEHLGKLVCKDS
jgi:protein-tyrosine-phosphatase